jgi:uncharacterized membrane-anchored protein YhcB (DUF1043 family)
MTSDVFAAWTPGPLEILIILIVIGIPVFLVFMYISRGSKERQRISKELERLTNELEQVHKQAEESKRAKSPPQAQ